MDRTPRMRSAFPQTPEASPNKQRQRPNGTPASAARPAPASKLRSIPSPASSVPSAPLVPFDVIDAPSQRAYVALLYGLLHAWRFYEYFNLVADDTESMWSFLKWSGIDFILLFGLPVLRIPWLEWSSFSTSLIWFAHMLLNLMLMFRIGIPVHLWLAGVFRLINDSELGLMGKSVKPADVIQNASLILGKQIINILPEGSALLNPSHGAFCIGNMHQSISIPIQINQTNPIEMQLGHRGLDNTEETISIGARELRRLRKQAEKHHEYLEGSSPLVLHYQVKKTGLYYLERVVDETKMEVRVYGSDLMVVACPQAEILPVVDNMCRNDVSEVTLQVRGTPPLQVKYRRLINDDVTRSEFQSVQPDDFVSPYGKSKISSAMISAEREDLSWAQFQSVNVPLSENLLRSGVWSYAIEEVVDALGNKHRYTATSADETSLKPTDPHRHQVFTVHERPKVKLRNCNYQNPLQVAKGSAAPLPLFFESTGKGAIQGASHTVKYIFTPENELTASGDHGENPARRVETLRSSQDSIVVQESGLYSLQSVKTEYCAGEVLEPASCLLQNPPEPELTMTKQDIFDKCAKKPIGVRVDLDLVGSPPFRIGYRMEGPRGVVKPHQVEISGLRGQLTLTPPEAGKHVYRFTDISDKVYKDQPLNEQIVQDVTPAASAFFTNPTTAREACLDDSVSYNVRLQGEGPWTLEYELVHNGRRIKYKAEDIHAADHTITTEKLTSGGEYKLVLKSIKDRLGCEEFLKDEVRFKVRNEKPKAYFGHLDGKRTVDILEGKNVKIPLRLTGKAPWVISYRSSAQPSRVEKAVMRDANTALSASAQAIYELVDVADDVCPGTFDEKMKQFEVTWIKRPALAILENASIKVEGTRHVKTGVCEGDEDSFDITLSGTPPYHVVYDREIHPDRGQRSIRTERINPPLGSANIRCGTDVAGLHSYKFTKLNDANYASKDSRETIAALEQRVFPRPDAEFVYPGRTYSYCTQEAEGEEVIPIKLTGVPPFSIEFEVKHISGRARVPETINMKNIPGHTFDIRIPHNVLQHGISHVYIRKVQDDRGCQRRSGLETKRVSISVHDAPSVAAVNARSDICVGDRLAYTLSGTPPFTVFTTFNNRPHQANSPDTTFRRLAEAPGSFAVTGISDNASNCKASTNLSAIVHPMPTVRISGGRVTSINLREGGETEIVFDFTGTPPFEVTYTRSTLVRSGQRSKVLETRVERTSDFSIRVKAGEEGQYEAIAIKDKWCAFPRPGDDARSRKGQKLLQN